MRYPSSYLPQPYYHGNANQMLLFGVVSHTPWPLMYREILSKWEEGQNVFIPKPKKRRVGPTPAKTIYLEGVGRAGDRYSPRGE